jgi:hypothetical protein
MFEYFGTSVIQTCYMYIHVHKFVSQIQILDTVTPQSITNVPQTNNTSTIVV